MMAFWDKQKRRKMENMAQAVDDYFKTIGGYTPTFTTFAGGIYEMEQTRAAIHTIATHISKLNPVVKGAANPLIARNLKTQPNAMMDTKKYLYRLATLLCTDNNVIIAPLYDDFYQKIVGYYPLKISKCEIVEDGQQRYIRYRFENGDAGAVPFSECGILNQMQYENEIWGETNACLRPTLEMLNARNQSIVEGVKSSGLPRFIARMSGIFKRKDIDDARKDFREFNLNAENTGGAIFVDSKISDIKQINQTAYVVDEKQAAEIRESVYDYFGVNQQIIQNKFTSDEWNAFYNGKLAPIALEMSMVHTNMTFTPIERSHGNEIMFYSNRLQYMANAEKLNMVTQLFDRGFLTHNQGLQIFDMPPVDGGDRYYIRKEYADINDLYKINGGLAAGLGVDEYAENEDAGIQDGTGNSAANGGTNAEN